MSDEQNQNEKMAYGMVGDDGLTDEQRRNKYTGDVDCEYLEPHIKQGVVIFVDPSIDLDEAGAAFSSDDKVKVDAWLKAGDLVKVDELHLKWWQSQKTRFMAQIVKPFVLVKEIK